MSRPWPLVVGIPAKKKQKKRNKCKWRFHCGSTTPNRGSFRGLLTWTATHSRTRVGVIHLHCYGTTKITARNNMTQVKCEFVGRKERTRNENTANDSQGGIPGNIFRLHPLSRMLTLQVLCCQSNLLVTAIGSSTLDKYYCHCVYLPFHRMLPQSAPKSVGTDLANVDNGTGPPECRSEAP